MRTLCAQGWRLGLLAALVALGPPAWGQEAPRDPVARLARTLAAPVSDLAARDAELRARVEALSSLDQLRRAVLLYEWRDGNADEALAAVDARHRATVVARFERAVRSALRGEVGQRLETLKMLGGLDGNLRGSDGAPLTRALGKDLAELLRGDAPAVRESAARALGRLAPDPAVAVPALSDLLRDPDPQLRSAAAVALGDLVAGAAARWPGQADEVVTAGKFVVPAAAAGLADPSATVRRHCAEAVGRCVTALGGLVSEPAVAKVDDWETYQAEVARERDALRPLVRALQAQAPALARASGDADLQVRLRARQALEEVALVRVRLIRRATSALAPEDERAPERHGEVFAFLREDPLLDVLRPALPALIAGVEDVNVRGRQASIDALETIGHAAAEAVPALVRALSDRDRFVRWAAARALGRVRPADPAAVVPHLARAVSEGDSDQRRAAADALRQYGPAGQAAVPALVQAARASDPGLRVAALRALESIGSAEEAALAVLNAALNDPDARVREVAAGALRQLGPSQSEAANALLRPPAGTPPKAVGSAERRR